MEVENQGRLVIFSLKNQGISTKNVSDKLNLHGYSYTERGINKVYSQYKERGTHLTNLQNAGRPSIDMEVEEEIVDHFEHNFSSLQEFQRDPALNHENISTVSIKRIINDNGIKSYRLGKAIPINVAQKKERLAFAKRVARWQAKWKTIAFQDETWFEITNFGKTHAWARDQDDIPSDLCRKINKYPLKIHFFGIISFEGPLKLIRVDDNINSLKFIEFLDQSLEQISDKTLCLDQANFHTSKETTNWLDNNQIDYLLLPPKVADINLIENIWYILQQEVFKQTDKVEQVEDLDSLHEFVESTFFGSKKIKDSIRHAYNSLPKRISKIIEKQGY